MKNQVIINTEYFLNCAGSCAGCFLSDDERNNSSVNMDKVIPVLKKMVKKFIIEQKGKDFFVIGFGRGNNLLLKNADIEFLGNNIKSLEDIIVSKEIIFEVSTSLIGKIETQISNAKKLLSFSNKIYFNVVINSEITSKNFWKNLKYFHQEMTAYREILGMIDKTGDILVLNINPSFLPDLEELISFATGIKSPINISIFPFDKKYIEVNKETMLSLKNWTIKVSEYLKDYDLNIKNQLGMIDFYINGFESIESHVNKTRDTYYFIDKNGQISNGQPSIMGEVDYPRLLEKYEIDINLKKAYIQMQKIKPCTSCLYQKECLITGAYLNMLANIKRVRNTGECPSGYREFFTKFLPN